MNPSWAQLPRSIHESSYRTHIKSVMQFDSTSDYYKAFNLQFGPYGWFFYMILLKKLPSSTIQRCVAVADAIPLSRFDPFPFGSLPKDSFKYQLVRAKTGTFSAKHRPKKTKHLKRIMLMMQQQPDLQKRRLFIMCFPLLWFYSI